MKKIFSFLLVACFTATLFGQTIVSTTPANRNMVLEELTGKTCQYCPDGHKRAQQLMNQYPGRFFAINVHQGGYASGTPNYTTPYGNALASQAGMGQNNTGYPAGTVNRQVFTGVSVMGASYFLYDRDKWANCAAIGLAEPSCCNVAAAGTLDWNTRHLTLLVEVYYTGNGVGTTNKLTVAMLQSEILGPQTGASQWYPEMMVGSEYRHMHMLRDFITGTQWGMDVSPVTAGSFWSYTFEYDIPQHFNNIDVILENLEFIVFVTENEKKIITGAEAAVTHTNMPALNARIDNLNEIQVSDCSNDANAYIKVKNVGQNTINSVELTYTIANGTPHTLVWNNRPIASMASDTIHLPIFEVLPNVNQTVKVDLIKANNTNITLSTKTITIKKEVVVGDANKMTLVIKTDAYAYETSCRIFNPDGTVLFEKLNGFTNNTEHKFDFIPVMEGCHRVEVYDSYGDGTGNIKILNSAETQIYYNNGKFGSKLTTMVSVTVIPVPGNFVAQADTVTRKVTLTWNDANTPASDSFTLYFNDVLLQQNITTTTFVHENVPVGTHTYGIKAIVGNTFSAIITTTVVMSEIVECNQAKNIQGAYIPETEAVVLTWEDGNAPSDYFKVLFNGELLQDTIKTTTFTHENVPAGEHTYGIVAVIKAINCIADPVETSVTVLGILEFNNLFKVYPNPTNNYVFVEGKDIESVSIYNSFGQLVKNEITTDEIIKINTKDINSGLYFLQIKTKSGMIGTEKIVITK